MNIDDFNSAMDKVDKRIKLANVYSCIAISIFFEDARPYYNKKVVNDYAKFIGVKVDEDKKIENRSDSHQFRIRKIKEFRKYAIKNKLYVEYNAR